MITSIFAGILGFFYTLISFYVVRRRRTLKISLGSGDNPIMLQAISAHSNFQSYVPIFLILLYLLEVYSAIPVEIIITLGCFFTLGRILHFRGITTNNFKLRVPGMIMTFVPITLSSLLNLFARFFY